MSEESEADKKPIEKTVVSDKVAEREAFELAADGKDITPVEPEIEPEEVNSEPEPEPEEVKPEPEPEDDNKGGQAKEQELPADIQAKLNEFDELKSRINLLDSRVMGKIGNFEQRINAIPKQTVSTISPKAKERLQDEFPELAELLFGEASAEQEPAQPVSQQQPAQQEAHEVDLQQPKQEISQQDINNIIEEKLLTHAHPDWQETTQSEEFAKFMQSKTPDEYNKFYSSFDSSYLAKIISDFKDTQAKQNEQASNKSEEAQKKRNRLKAAITPRGTQPSADITLDDEEAAMEAAFNS